MDTAGVQAEYPHGTVDHQDEQPADNELPAGNRFGPRGRGAQPIIIAAPLNKKADHERNRQHARIAYPKPRKGAEHPGGEGRGGNETRLDQFPAAVADKTIDGQGRQEEEAQQDLYHIGQRQRPHPAQKNKRQVSAQDNGNHQPQRRAQETLHDERHGHHIHGHHAGDTQQRSNADHHPGARVKAHLQPLGNGVRAAAPNIRAGKNAVRNIADHQGQAAAQNPAEKAVLYGQAGNDAGHAAGERNAANAGNPRNEADLPAGQQKIAVGAHPAFGIPAQPPEQDNQGQNGGNKDRHGSVIPQDRTGARSVRTRAAPESGGRE